MAKKLPTRTLRRRGGSRVRSRRLPAVIAAVAVVLAAGGFGVYQYDSHKVPTSSAATSLNQYCLTIANGCLNAWGGGGGLVKLYNKGTKNNDFRVVPVGGSNFAIKFYNYDECIGDAGNNPNNHTAALLYGACPGDPAGAGWGTNFTVHPCPLGVAFRNNHSGGWLGPGGPTANGTQLYLNEFEQFCFYQLPPA